MDPKRSIIALIFILIFGIIIVSVGIYFIYLSGTDPDFRDLAQYSVGGQLSIFGGVITGLDIIGGIYLLLRFRRKEILTDRIKEWKETLEDSSDNVGEVEGVLSRWELSCSRCGHKQRDDERVYKHCPHCGSHFLEYLPFGGVFNGEPID